MSNVSGFILRCGSAAAKLIFVAYLGYRSEEAALGQYAVFATIVIVFTQLAGLEVYQTITRRLHTATDSELYPLFQAQTFATFAAYIVLGISAAALYPALLGPYWSIGVLILCLEHYTTELHRLKTAQLRPTQAALILFAKNAGWVLVFVTLHGLGLIGASIQFILIIWLLFLVIAAIIGSPPPKVIASVFRHRNPVPLRNRAWRLAWASRYFMASAATIAGIGSIDKFFVAGRFSIEQTGAYYFYQTLASIPALLISFSIGATLWPKCVELAATNRLPQYEVLWKRLSFLYVVTAGLAATALALMAPLAFRFMSTPRYDADVHVLYLLLASSVAFALCEPYKLDLYTKHQDAALLAGNVLHLSLVLVMVLLGLGFGSLGTTSAGLLAGNTLALVAYRLKVPQAVARRLKASGAAKE